MTLGGYLEQLCVSVKKRLKNIKYSVITKLEHKKHLFLYVYKVLTAKYIK